MSSSSETSSDENYFIETTYPLSYLGNFCYDAGCRRQREAIKTDMFQDWFSQDQTPNHFTIQQQQDINTYSGEQERSFEWNEDLLKDFLDLFYHFHEKGIIWKSLTIEIHEYNFFFVRTLLWYCNTESMKVFKEIHLIFAFDYPYVADGEENSEENGEENSEENSEENGEENSEEYSEYDNFLCPDLPSNTFIQELTIECKGKLSRGVCRELNRLLQTNLPCIQTLVMDAVCESTWLLPGLRDNRTLKTIDFKITNTEYGFDEEDNYLSEEEDSDPPRLITDADTSAVVGAIARNPNLESLSMTCFSYEIGVEQIGDLTSEAFKTLLTNSTSLKKLKIDHFPPLNAECFIQGLKNSRSLKRLHLESKLYGDLIFARLFRILPDCPLLEEIQLDNENISILSEEDLVQVKLLPRLPRPIILKLATIRNNVPYKLVVELLRCHPELLLSVNFVPDDVTDDATRTELLHAIDMNWYGRYLLDRTNVSLSIWPLILEEVSQVITYELVKGLAEAGRISSESRGI